MEIVLEKKDDMVLLRQQRQYFHLIYFENADRFLQVPVIAITASTANDTDL